MKRKDKGGEAKSRKIKNNKYKSYNESKSEEYKKEKYKAYKGGEGEEYNIVYEINDISKKKIRGGKPICIIVSQCASRTKTPAGTAHLLVPPSDSHFKTDDVLTEKFIFLLLLTFVLPVLVTLDNS